MMLRITGKNFIGFKRGSEGKVSLKSFNPSNNCEINHVYNLASQNELDDALLLADRASKIYMKKTGIEKAEFLDAIAKAIMRIGDDLIKICTEETGLAEERIIGERDRTCKQLHLFSEILRAGTWIDARIDPRIEKRSVDIRRMLVPIGPIAVFGASNFPLAFSVAGGDTASAFAAGCTVIFK
ncbi:MAG TPA: aldehyde dehydrogenase family protein, partial [Arachidicoccus soli]|nr:aldehyde dehydrogenase family protein [Arachidicoccus soli]